MFSPCLLRSCSVLPRLHSWGALSTGRGPNWGSTPVHHGWNEGALPCSWGRLCHDELRWSLTSCLCLQGNSGRGSRMEWLQEPSEFILLAPVISNNSTNGETKGQRGEGFAQAHKAISGLKSMINLPSGSARGEASRFLWGQLCSYVLR